ncbi:MAG: zinc ribbon domain-containing protein, partial [archaeon]
MPKQQYCSKCGTPINQQDQTCPTCGYNLEEWMQTKNIQETPTHQPSTIELLTEALKALYNPKPMSTAPSSSVYLNRTQKNITGYLLSATMLLITGFALSYGGEWLTYIGFTLAGYTVPVI